MNSKHIKLENLQNFNGQLKEGMKVISFHGKYLILDVNQDVNQDLNFSKKCQIDINKNEIIISQGISEGYRIVIPEGTLSIDKNIITINSGYYFQNQLQIKKGNYSVNQGYIQLEEGYYDESIIDINNREKYPVGVLVSSENEQLMFQKLNYDNNPPTFQGDPIPIEGCYIFNTGMESPDYGNSINNSMEIYKCVEVDTENKTWCGYLAVLNNGVYSFSDTITEGLSYSTVVPRLSRIYTTDALIEVKSLYDGTDYDPSLVFYAPLTAEASTTDTEQTLTAYDVSYATYYNVPCCALKKGAYIAFSDFGLPTGSSAFTVSLWVYIQQVNGTCGNIFGWGTRSRNNMFYIIVSSSDFNLSLYGTEYNVTPSKGLKYWNHILATYDGSNIKFYINGEIVGNYTHSLNIISYGTAYAGVNGERAEHMDGYVTDIRVYNRVLDDGEITELANTFVF